LKNRPPSGILLPNIVNYVHRRETALPVGKLQSALAGGMWMVAPAVEGIDLFKIAGRSISGWIPSFKTGTAGSIRQPFCSQLA